MAKFADVDAYLAAASPGTREVLSEIRRRIRARVPEGTETIRYDMPTIQLDGRSLVHFAGWAKHVSIYPTPDAPALAAELAPYDSGRGTLRFPLSAEIPYELIDRVVQALLVARAAEAT